MDVGIEIPISLFDGERVFSDFQDLSRKRDQSGLFGNTCDSFIEIEIIKGIDVFVVRQM